MSIVRRPQGGATGTGYQEGSQKMAKKNPTPVRNVGKPTGPKGGKGGNPKKGSKIGY